MATVAVGQQAEAAVAKHLEQQSYEILDRNWRTRVCEIDLVAKKDKIVYFVEVKYRAGGAQGTGFEYIASNKLKQLKFAASLWAQNNNWEGDSRIVAAEVTGPNFESINLEEIDTQLI